MCSSCRFRTAIERFDSANAADPTIEIFEGNPYPRELLYARRMTRWLERLEPDASEPLRLAARAQHLRRWMIPRADYPAGRRGYLRWRTALYHFHARQAGEILRETGYDEDTVVRVEQLLRKEGLRHDSETQTLEDAACLVFLEHHLADFSLRQDPHTLVRILRKTWDKMSPRARGIALQTDLPPLARELIEKALAEEGK